MLKRKAASQSSSPSLGGKKLFQSTWFSILVPLVLLFLGLGLRIAFPKAIEEVQLKVFDLFQRLKPRAYEEAPVRIVDIDDESLAKLGQWPWPRNLIARMVERLNDLGAAVIVFDIVFAEPDRTSPSQMLVSLPSSPDFETVRAKIKELEDHDSILADAFAQSRVVTGFSLIEEANAFRPASKAGMAFSGDDPKQYLADFKGAVVNLPRLEETAAGNGSFTILAERDGIIRRVPVLFRVGDNLTPSLVAEALRAAQGASTFIVKSSGASGEKSFGEHTGIAQLKIGDFAVPTDAQGRLWLYDTDHQKERFIPAWRVFEDPSGASSVPDSVSDNVSGSLIFIGTSAAGLKDLRATPLSPVTAGVEVHAQLAEQILLQNFLKRPDWAEGAELIYLAALGLTLILLLPHLGAAWCASLGIAAIAAAFAFSWHAFSSLHLLVDPVFPSLVALAIYLASSLIHFLKTEADRRQVRGAFSRYISPVMVERIAENPALLKLGGEMKNMTLLFCDIRGFTTISEQFNAEELTHFINQFLTPMTGIILNRQGTIDKYIGDCIMAFWNAPLDDPDHAKNACQAALDMRHHLAEWNEKRRLEAQTHGKKFIPIHTGIGINTGHCCVGNMGSDQRFDYSVMGDDVNLASRLEGQSKVYGVDIVLGQKSYDETEAFAFLELDLIKVKGKTKPVRIFTLAGDQTMKERPDFQKLNQRHQEMLAAYRAQDWEKAPRHLEECRNLDRALDGQGQSGSFSAFYDLYAERISDYKAHPPAPDWDGVTVATHK